MGFTQPCFIRKNTPELRKQLEELGYFYTYYHDGNGIYCYDNISQTFTYNNEIPKECIGVPQDNEHLFLTLAALRDDKPDYQWFLWEHNDGEYHPELEESWKQYIPGEHWEEWWWFEVRKATVEELIEHFKKE
jgi:hypothetical protein